MAIVNCLVKENGHSKIYYSVTWPRWTILFTNTVRQIL